jgi:transposase-like protein
MAKSLTPEEVSILIRARQIQRDKGLDKDFDVSSVCREAGVSRKTGYQWTEKHTPDPANQDRKELEEKLARLQAEYDQLKKDYEEVDFENRARKLAWEIHHVDELLADKKNTSASKTKKKR